MPMDVVPVPGLPWPLVLNKVIKQSFDIGLIWVLINSVCGKCQQQQVVTWNNITYCLWSTCFIKNYNPQTLLPRCRETEAFCCIFHVSVNKVWQVWIICLTVSVTLSHVHRAACVFDVKHKVCIDSEGPNSRPESECSLQILQCTLNLTELRRKVSVMADAEGKQLFT